MTGIKHLVCTLYSPALGQVCRAPSPSAPGGDGSLVSPLSPNNCQVQFSIPGFPLTPKTDHLPTLAVATTSFITINTPRGNLFPKAPNCSDSGHLHLSALPWSPPPVPFFHSFSRAEGTPQHLPYTTGAPTLHSMGGCVLLIPVSPLLTQGLPQDRGSVTVWQEVNHWAGVFLV